MASPFVAAGEESKEQAQAQAPSPRTMKRTWSLNSSSACEQGAGTPKCVCAPATHAGSFKCRLHRVNSQAPMTQPPATTPMTQPPAVAVSSTSTWTVEAL